MILRVLLWCSQVVDHAAALKCCGYGFESLLAGYLDKGSVHCRGPQFVIVQGSVQCGGMYTGDTFFKNLSLKLTNQKQPKVTCVIQH